MAVLDFRRGFVKVALLLICLFSKYWFVEPTQPGGDFVAEIKENLEQHVEGIVKDDTCTSDLDCFLYHAFCNKPLIFGPAKCKSCDNTCLTCDGPGPTDCTKCFPGMKLYYGWLGHYCFECVKDSDCPDGFYCAKPWLDVFSCQKKGHGNVGGDDDDDGVVDNGDARAVPRYPTREAEW